VSEVSTASDKDTDRKDDEKEKDGSLTTQEGRETGTIKLQVVCAYVRYIGCFMTFLIFFTLTAMQFTRNFNDWWLSHWVTETQHTQAFTNNSVLSFSPPSSSPSFSAFPFTSFSSSSLFADTSVPSLFPPTSRPSTAHVSPFSSPVSLMDSWTALTALAHTSFTSIHGSLSSLSHPSSLFSSSSDSNNPENKNEEHNEESTHNDNDSAYYLRWLAYIALANSIATFARAFSFAYGCLCAAQNMYRSLLARVMKATVLFFDTNPIGRILNRFSSDMYAYVRSRQLLCM
jgi:ATP-binding cassette subfamily C (CFTR/MRP) protein 10